MADSKAKVVAIQMPQVGNTMEEGTILSWKVGVGDRVKVGEVIMEVETDKAAVEVEAAAEGRLARIVVGEGETVKVLTPVAYLAESDGELDEYLAAHKGEKGEEKTQLPIANRQLPIGNETGTAEKVKVASPEEGRQKVSPAARRLAAQQGVDVGKMGAGSGPGGRVVTEDVERAGRGGDQWAMGNEQRGSNKGKRKEMTPMRRAIALGLQASKQTIPHFYMEREIDAEPLVRFCKERKGTAKAVGVNDVIVYACGKAVGEFAEFRSRVEQVSRGTGEQVKGMEGRAGENAQDVMVEMESANIGVAVETPAGLMVPVVKGVEKRTLAESAAETKRVIEAARNGKLIGIGEGVFTVSNLGMMGVDRFSAIINPPEAAILAVGAAREVAVVVKGTISVGKRMSLTLSCDHRVVDGSVAAKFLNRLKEMLETPGTLE